MLWKNKNPGFVKWGSRQWMRERERILKGEKEGLKKMVETLLRVKKGFVMRVKTMMKNLKKNNGVFVLVLLCSCVNQRKNLKGIKGILVFS